MPHQITVVTSAVSCRRKNKQGHRDPAEECSLQVISRTAFPQACYDTRSYEVANHQVGSHKVWDLHEGDETCRRTRDDVCGHDAFPPSFCINT